MDVLIYNELDTSRVKKQVDKVLDMIQRDDFFSADIKKLAGTPYYRAKLDYANRLLFKIVEHQHKKVALILEIIHQHAYEKSRFLNGASVDEERCTPIRQLTELEQEKCDVLPHLNAQNQRFHLLDKIISFDHIQEAIFELSPPLVIIGSAGSGKTMLTLEKMKTCPGEVLYVTGSPYLVQNARQLYYANHYANDAQEINFLSYRELLETIHVPAGQEMDFPCFVKWLSTLRQAHQANKLYEEFKGVITGNRLDKAYLSREDYLQLGIKQSIYPVEERSTVFDLFEKYLAFLTTSGRYDMNLVSYHHLAKAKPIYDFVVVDEVQDFTAVQLALILKTLQYSQQFVLCGDSNQIVHPNFFSWAKVKSLFYEQKTTDQHQTEIIRILTKNYRNAPNVTTIANKILKIKNLRFGSIDKESHYLVESESKTPGEVYCLRESPAICRELDEKTRKSTQFAVIVLRDDQKEAARQVFQTPLIFSIYEAKGLEYENVILYQFLSSDEKNFRELTQGVIPDDLHNEFVYSRVKDKSDRSLEIYKFFINALYVAITRAIKNVYFIERLEQHPLLTLLDLQTSSELVAISVQESSIEEWQKEARRLELQGKQEQAAAIRESILKNKPVPWKIMTPELVAQLHQRALNTVKPDKEARLLLFDYAMQYHQPKLFHDLADVRFGPALKQKRDYDLLERKYFMSYTTNNPTQILRQTSQYGIDFRTEFNQTPLMTACHFGNAVLVKELIDKGANPSLVDNIGRSAFQLALHQALLNRRFAQEKLLAVYDGIVPEGISLQVDEQLVKIDAHRMEFMLINAMMVLIHQKPITHIKCWSFRVDDFLETFAHFPEQIMPERRKRRAYVSSILAKHEINRQDRYNKRLFLRVVRGYYILNPAVLLKIEHAWVNVYALLDLEATKTTFLDRLAAWNALE